MTRGRFAPLERAETPDNFESEIDSSFWEWANNNPAQYPTPEELHDMELQLHSDWLERNFPGWYGTPPYPF